MTTQAQTIAQAYLAAWNESDGARRRDLLAQAWSEQPRYSDPMMSGHGQGEIAAMIENARAQFAGHEFVLSGTPDSSGANVRFSWSLVRTADGAEVAVGTDFVRTDARGRIAEVVGFLDRMPQ